MANWHPIRDTVMPSARGAVHSGPRAARRGKGFVNGKKMCYDLFQYRNVLMKPYHTEEKMMKRFVIVLLAVCFCCSVLSAGPARADVSHVSENLNAKCDYLVLSPEYSSSRGCWELWLLAYRKSGSSPDDEKDTCVSASLLSFKNPASAANKIATLSGSSYEEEDMMEYDGVRYLMFYELRKPCYLSSPGGTLTTVAPVNDFEFQEGRNDCTVYISSQSSSPGFMLLCQLWLYAGRFRQIPSSVVKTFGFDNKMSQSLYSNSVNDYCSNQEKLQRYCDSLIPVVTTVNSWDTDNKHSATDICYRKGNSTLTVCPLKDGLAILLTAGK